VGEATCDYRAASIASTARDFAGSRTHIPALIGERIGADTGRCLWSWPALPCQSIRAPAQASEPGQGSRPMEGATLPNGASGSRAR